MKSLLRRVLPIFVLAAPFSAFAHPGHEDDHDFTWSFSHLVAHPLATLLCLGLISAGALLAWRLAARAERAALQPLRRRPR